MRNRYLLVGTVASAVLASFAIMNPLSDSEDKGAYEARKGSALEASGRSACGAQEFMNVLKADPVTGVVDYADVKRAEQDIQTLYSRSAVLTWDEEGPSNIGGRTRAILVNNQDQYQVLAGSVSGGLFHSGNRGDYWTKVATFSENLAISSMAQTPNGTIVIGTGHSAEGHGGCSGGNTGAYGNGVWVYAGGDLTQNPTMISGSDSWQYINEVVADTVNNVVWILTSNDGIWTYNTDNATLTNVSSTVGSSSGTAGVISKDGLVICISGGFPNKRTYVSRDGGATFIDYSNTSNTSNPIPASIGRYEFAISHERAPNGNYFLYGTRGAGDGTFAGAYVSSDNGQNWFEIAPNSNGGTGAFNPYRDQGWWNNIITVVPGYPERALLGGIDIYSWAANVNNPTFGSWNQNTNWALSPTSPIYAHADQHEMKWDNLGRFYIGNDGGVGYSDDKGETYVPANRGYNVTQFYSVAYSAHGDILGGTQDNGSLYNDHTNFQWQDFSEILGGDGFDCDISHSNRNMVFTTLYYCGIYRSSDRGLTQYPFYPQQLATSLTPGSTEGPGNFNTVIRFHEVYDLNSPDSVIYLPTEALSAGTEITIPSLSTGDSISYTTVDSVRYEDTVNYDPNIVSYEYIVTDCESSANRDLGIEHPWLNINSGQYPPLIGDTILFFNDPLDISDDDTVVVCDTIRYRFYYATDPNVNDTLAMHMDSVLYNVPWDTIKVQDPYVSWLALGIGQGNWVGGQRDLGIWMSRYAKRFADNVGGATWLNVQPNVGGSRVMCMEFSRNADFLYVGTQNGGLYRLTGYNDYYASTPGIVDSLQGWNPSNPGGNPVVTQWDLIWTASGGNCITGIGVDYGMSTPDGDHLVVCMGGFSGTVHAVEITNASTCPPNGANDRVIHSSSEFNFPVYDAIIDRNDPNFVALATEYGVYITQNVSATNPVWEDCSDGFGNVPVHAIRQDWRTFGEGSFNPGKIYIGTHGRGIWSTGSLLSLPDDLNVGIDKEKFETNLTLYPNPLQSTGFLNFKLENNEDVYINIYSLSGKLVKNISRSNLPKGDNTIDFNASELPIGTYLIQFKAGNQVETTKFVKTR